jgi:hypothetical protein
MKCNKFHSLPWTKDVKLTFFPCLLILWQFQTSPLFAVVQYIILGGVKSRWCTALVWYTPRALNSPSSVKLLFGIIFQPVRNGFGKLSQARRLKLQSDILDQPSTWNGWSGKGISEVGLVMSEGGNQEWSIDANVSLRNDRDFCHLIAHSPR